MTPTLSYTVELENFHGPLDLLLSLIERRELEVTDVSVGQVTSDYLATVAALEKVHATELSWFLDIATRLIFFKARALGTTAAADDETSDLTELTEELMRYKLYRELAADLASRLTPITPRDKPALLTSTDTRQKPANLSLNRLLSAYRSTRLLAVQPARPIHTVTITRHDIAKMMKTVLTNMQSKQRLTNIFDHTDRKVLTLRLLALLELAKQGAIEVFMEGETGYAQAI